MKILRLLLFSDFKAILGWFKNQTAGKIFVLLGFLSIFLIVGISLYFLSSLFFTPLNFYGKYGFLTAAYILQSAVIVLSIFVIGSGIISTLTFLLANNFEMDYLMVLPVPAKIIVSWLFIRTFLLNLLFFFIIFFPIGFAFIKIFFADTLIISTIRLVFVMVLLVISTNAIGSALSFFISKLIKGRSLVASLTGGIIFIGFISLILKIIFPKELISLYSSSPDRFLTIYKSLPLTNVFLPTYWFSQAIVSGGIYLGISIIVSLILVFVFEYYQSYNLISLYQSVKIKSRDKVKSYFGTFVKSKNPLMVKDFLSVRRTSSEIGYLFFLVLMGLVFFLIISVSSSLSERVRQYDMQFIVFSFSWLMFFATAYMLRLVFPLMAREGKAASFLFSLPVKKNKIMSSKIYFSLLISLPYLALSFLIWIIYPFGRSDLLFLGLISCYSIILISVVNSLLGSILPNFNEGDNAERVSTSALGIIALFLSLLISVINSFIVYFVMTDYVFAAAYMFISAFFYLGVISVLFSFFKSHFNYYQL